MPHCDIASVSLSFNWVTRHLGTIQEFLSHLYSHINSEMKVLIALAIILLTFG